jgi:CRISPR-associated endonuclease/helicase Cas3
VDQAELGALNVKHCSLRMLGLAGKVVIVDEVHAYDTYMTTVVERLLEWLSALGTSVILLSATLPQTRRAALLKAYGAPGPAPEHLGAYPGLWIAGNGGSYHAAPAAYQANREVKLAWLSFSDGESEAKARWLLRAVAQGGCACWITNTVRRAQQMYRALRALDPGDVDTMLLHAAFPLDQRQELERQLASKYGPHGVRPRRAVVIGTQVLEQSLDLDFDVMVSDLAPVDLLLQRAGRLHRHERKRPAVHDMPRLWVNSELDGHDSPALGADAYVYAEFYLRQTWSVLRGRTQINLPADYRLLVEAVYDARPPAAGEPLSGSWGKLEQQMACAQDEARQRLLPAPNPRDPICDPAARLHFTEDESGTAWIVARTRLGEESVAVIPLVRVGEKAYVYPEGRLLDLEAPAPREAQLELLRRGLRVSNRWLVEALQSQRDSLPPVFQSPLLRGYQPLWLTEGRMSLRTRSGTWIIILDPWLGLVLEKEAAA